MNGMLGDRLLRKFVGTIPHRVKKTLVDAMDAFIDLETGTGGQTKQEPPEMQVQETLQRKGHPDEPGAS